MYGMINIAIEELVRRSHGAATWDAIRLKAGVADETFVKMQSYPDELTYQLVEAASSVLGITPPQVLEAFGEHWVLYTAQEGYGDLLAMGGATMPEFLEKLENLHTHVALGFPQLRPPSFWCTDVSPASLRLHYQSTRPGLGPMVIGLLRGLGKLYKTRTRVTHDRTSGNGADHDEFLVQFLPPA